MILLLKEIDIDIFYRELHAKMTHDKIDKVRKWALGVDSVKRTQPKSI